MADKAKSKTKMIEIENCMTAGKLFTSQGICKAGERITVPADEAKAYCAPQIIKGRNPDNDDIVIVKRAPKARIPFPDDDE